MGALMSILYLILSILLYSFIIYSCILKFLIYLKEEKKVRKNSFDRIKNLNKIIMLFLKIVLLIFLAVEFFIFFDTAQKIGVLKESSLTYCAFVFVAMSFYSFVVGFIGVHILELNLDNINKLSREDK